jgi:hypothetical protein
MTNTELVAEVEQQLRQQALNSPNLTVVPLRHHKVCSALNLYFYMLLIFMFMPACNCSNLMLLTASC